MMNMILEANFGYYLLSTIESVFIAGGICVALPIVIVWMVVRARTQKMERKMAILTKAVENGQQIDPALLVAAEKNDDGRYRLKNSLLVKLILGISLVLSGLMAEVLFILHGDIVLPLHLAALVVFSVGVGFFVSYFVGRKFLAKEIEIEEKRLQEAEEKLMVEEPHNK